VTGLHLGLHLWRKACSCCTPPILRNTTRRHHVEKKTTVQRKLNKLVVAAK